MDRYFARSASDHADDWPCWYVADRGMGNLNVTARLIGRMFAEPAAARKIADAANAGDIKPRY